MFFPLDIYFEDFGKIFKYADSLKAVVGHPKVKGKGNLRSVAIMERNDTDLHRKRERMPKKYKFSW